MKKLILTALLLCTSLSSMALEGKYRLCNKDSESSSMQVQLLFIGDEMVNSVFLFKDSATCDGKPDWQNIITTKVEFEGDHIMKVKTGKDSFTKATYTYEDYKLTLKFEDVKETYILNRVD